MFPAGISAETGARIIKTLCTIYSSDEADGADFVLRNLASDMKMQTDTNGEREDSASLINLLD